MKFYTVPTVDGGRVLVKAETVVNAAPFGAVEKARRLLAEGYGDQGVCFETGLRLFEVHAISEHFGV